MARAAAVRRLGGKARVLAGAVLLLAATLLALHAPPVRDAVRVSLAERLTAATGFDVRIEALDYDLLRLRARARGVRLAAPPTSPHPFFLADELSLEVSPSLFRGVFGLKRLDVSGGRVALRRDADRSWNLPRGPDSGKTGADAGAPAERPPIGQLRVDGLDVILQDEVSGLRARLGEVTVASEGAFADILEAELTIPTLEAELRGVIARGRGRAALGFDGRRLEVRGLEIVTEPLRLEGGGALDLLGAAPELTLRFRGELETEALAPALPSSARARGGVAFTVGVSGRRTAPRFTIDVDSSALEIGASGPLRVSLAGEHTEGTSVLRSLELAGFGGGAVASGDLAWGEDGGGHLNVRTEGIGLQRLVSLWGGAAPPPALATRIDAEGSFSWSRPALVALAGSLAARATPRPPEAGVSGTVQIDLGGGRYDATLDLALPELGLSSRVGGALAGEIAASNLEGRLEATLGGLQDLEPLIASLGGNAGPQGFSGRVRLDADVSGSVSAPVVRGQLRSDDLRIAGLGPAAGHASVALADAILSVAHVRLEEGDNAVDAAGDLDFRHGTIDAEVNADVRDLSRLSPWLPGGTVLESGVLQARGRVAGPLRRPEVRARVALNGLTGDGWAIDDATADVEACDNAVLLDLRELSGSVARLPFRLDEPGRLTLTPTSLGAEHLRLPLGESSVATLDGDLANGLRLVLEAEATDLGPLLPGNADLVPSGRLGARIVARGSLDRVTLDGTAETVALEARLPGREEPARIDAALELAEGRLRLRRLEGSWLGAQLAASGELPLRLAESWLPGAVVAALPQAREAARLEATLDSLTPASFAAMTGASPSLPGEGEVRARLTLESPVLELDAVRGRLEVEQASIELPDTRLALAEPATAKVQDGVLRLSGFTWRGPHGWLGLEGEAAARGDHARARLQADLDLRVLDAFAPVAAEGRVSVDLHAETSPAGRLELLGSLGFDGGGFVTNDPDVDVSGLTGRLELDGDAVRFHDVRARVNGGTVVASGEIGVEREAPLRLELQGQSLGLTLYPELRGEVDLDVALSGTLERPKLGGRLDVVHAAYRGRRAPYAVYADLMPRWAPPERATLVAVEPPVLLKRLALDVDIASSDVSWDNAYGRLAARVDLALRGTAAEPALDGIVSLRPGGDVVIGGTAVEVRSGTLRWDEARGLEPRLALSAYGHLSRYDVELRATGSPDDLDLALSSQPPLTQTELLGLIATGSASGAAGAADAQASRDHALGAVSRTALATFSEKVGLRGVRVSDAPVSLFGTDTTSRLTVAVRVARAFEVVRSQKLSEGSGTAQGLVWHPTRNVDATAYYEDADLVFEGRHRLELGTAGGLSAPPRAEQPRVSRVALDGEVPLPESLLRQKLRMSPGDRFDFFRWHDDQERLVAFLRTHGFREARLATRRRLDPDGRVALTYELDPGARTRLRFEGFVPSKSQQREIEQAWGWAPSDPLLAADLEKAARLVLSEDGYVEAAVRARIDRGPGVPTRDVVLEIEPGPRGRGHQIVFEGVSEADAESLQELMARSDLEKRGFVERARLEVVVVDDYVARGYMAVRVAATPPRVEQGRACLRVRVDTGPLYRLASVAVVLSPAMQDVAAAELTLKSGDPYLPLADAGAGRRLERHYRSLGYNDTRVETTRETDPEAARVALTFTVSAGPRQVVSEVALANAEATPSDVRRILQAQVGRPASSEAWLPVERELFGSGRYRDVAVAFEPLDGSVPGDDRQMQALVDLQPWPRWILEYGLSVRDSPSDPGRVSLPTFLSATAERRNLFKRPVTGRLEGGLGHRLRAVQGELNGARLFGRRVRSRLYAEHLRLGVDLDPDADSIVRDLEIHFTELGAEQRWRRGRADLTYGYRLTRADVLLDLGTEFEPLDIVQTISSPYVTLIHDGRDQPLDARHGHFHSSSFSVGIPAFGSDFRFTRYLVKQFGYGMVGRLVLAGGVRVGVSSGLEDNRNPTSNLLFRAGGGSTVRGYAENSLGPVDAQGVNGGGGLLILNAESRVSLNSWLEAAAFADAGNVWETTSQISLADLQYGLGFGLRVRLPFVALRLDLGFPTPRREQDKTFRLHFGIGQAF